MNSPNEFTRTMASDLQISPHCSAILQTSNSVCAAGKILNAFTVRSQFIGGMVWGVSFALHEHSTYDKRLGRIAKNNLAEHHVPVNVAMGEIDVFWVGEDDRQVSQIGAKGIGEVGITGTTAAITNAVDHATGGACVVYPSPLINCCRRKNA